MTDQIMTKVPGSKHRGNIRPEDQVEVFVGTQEGIGTKENDCQQAAYLIAQRSLLTLFSEGC